MLLELHTTLLVNDTSDCTRFVLEERVGLGLGDDSSLISLLCDLLDHLDQCIGDGHSWKALLSTMGARCRVTSQTGKQGKVQIEHIHEPIAVWTAVAAEYLHDLRLLCAAL